MRRGAFLVLVLAVCSAENCADEPCRLGLAGVTDCPTGARCMPVSSEEGVCVPLAAGPEVVGAYLNKRRAICEEKGHDFTKQVSKKLKCFRYVVGGVEKVVKSRTCGRCGGDIPVDDKGKCDETPNCE